MLAQPRLLRPEPGARLAAEPELVRQLSKLLDYSLGDLAPDPASNSLSMSNAMGDSFAPTISVASAAVSAGTSALTLSISPYIRALSRSCSTYSR